MFLDILYIYFEKPSIFLLLIPIVILFIFLLKKKFVKLNLNPEYESRRKKVKIVVFISRSLIILLLLIALATPFIERTKVIPGDPKVTILVDNSTSMELFDLNGINNLKSQLESSIPVELRYISSGEESSIGDGIVANMRRNENILLVSDGNNNHGITLGDVGVQANIINSTISVLNIIPNKYDASVFIYGSDKTISGVENTFTVIIQKTEVKQVRVIVEVDGRNILDQVTEEDQLEFKRSFDSGYHKIVAKIESEDHFKQNNIFYKNVKVVPKPKVLLYSKNDELVQLLNPLYELSKVDDLNVDLKPYNAIIVDDKDIEDLEQYYDKLSSFVSQGNGLFVIGGGNSYDSGNYTGSKFEQLLPAFVAKAGRKRGDVNIVLAIDISGSTGVGFGGYRKVDVEKALAIQMINNLSLVHNVGVVAFSSYAYNLAEIKTMMEHKDLPDKISRLEFGGGTNILEGIKASLAMLQNKGGSKNVIILSDGVTSYKKEILDLVKYSASQGVHFYTVGVGGDTDGLFLKAIAEEGNGVYFEPDTTQQIRLLFGDLESSGDRKIFPLVVLDKNHFITNNLKLKGTLYGFNQIVPKTTSKLLITTDIGDPILTVWRYGLGRVASLGTDYKIYGFELLNRDNSLLFTRTSNWVIGDPERNNARFIDIKDGVVGNNVEVLVKSDVQPVAEGIAFYKIEENLYRGYVTPNDVGFSNLLGAVYAVNYKLEYLDIGMNDELDKLVSATNGKKFNQDQTNEIVDFIKNNSRREVLTNKSYSWIFLLIALLLCLVEIGFRRMMLYRVI